eukprot:1161795-Pelagomonas_calceolata.AAC.13
MSTPQYGIIEAAWVCPGHIVRRLGVRGPGPSGCTYASCQASGSDWQASGRDRAQGTQDVRPCTVLNVHSICNRARGTQEARQVSGSNRAQGRIVRCPGAIGLRSHRMCLCIVSRPCTQCYMCTASAEPQGKMPFHQILCTKHCAHKWP